MPVPDPASDGSVEAVTADGGLLDDALLALAVDVAQRTGALLIRRLHEPRLSVTTKSSPTDLVSEVDAEAERLAVGALLTARPQDGVVAEEGTSHEGTSGVRWVLDPLDGTVNYLYGGVSFGVSLAAEVDGQVRVGVVVDPQRAETFWAVQGRGAWLDDARGRHRLACPAVDELSLALVATGFAYGATRRAGQARVAAQLLPLVRDIRRLGAAALDLCALAAGRVDAYYEQGLAPWDLAAGGLVAAEAGARVTDLAGGPSDGGFVVAAGPGLHGQLLELLRREGAGAH